MSHDDLIEERRRTWHGFVIFMGCSAAGVFLTLALMAVFLT